MEKIGLLARLRADFPDLIFQNAHDFYWSPINATVFYKQIISDDDRRTLLHELGHALLSHQNFTLDIDLIKMERDAWQYAQVHLAPTYEVSITDEHVEDALETYREWLHSRSRCPTCQMTGVQTGEKQYSCLGCSLRWKANDARRCSLRRYTKKAVR